jgi:hypothetical protein
MGPAPVRRSPFIDRAPTACGQERPCDQGPKSAWTQLLDQSRQLVVGRHRPSDLRQQDAVDGPRAQLRQVGIDPQVAEDPAPPGRAVDHEQ